MRRTSVTNKDKISSPFPFPSGLFNSIHRKGLSTSTVSSQFHPKFESVDRGLMWSNYDVTWTI